MQARALARTPTVLRAAGRAFGFLEAFDGEHEHLRAGDLELVGKRVDCGIRTDTCDLAEKIESTSAI